MVAHDENIGVMLNKLDELGIAEDTIVVYSTDNGVHFNTWPDGGITPFRSEKNTNWEGGWRVPAFVRWPGKFQAGTVLNGIVSHQDWLPTFLAAAGEPNIKEKLLKGHQAGDKTFKVHIDGYNMLPYLWARPRKAHGNSSSISMTTAISWRSGWATGKSCSWNNERRACNAGSSRS